MNILLQHLWGKKAPTNKETPHHDNYNLWTSDVETTSIHNKPSPRSIQDLQSLIWSILMPSRGLEVSHRFCRSCFSNPFTHRADPNGLIPSCWDLQALSHAWSHGWCLSLEAQSGCSRVSAEGFVPVHSLGTTVPSCIRSTGCYSLLLSCVTAEHTRKKPSLL